MPSPKGSLEEQTITRHKKCCENGLFSGMSISWIQTHSSNILSEVREMKIINNPFGLVFWGESFVYLRALSCS